MSGNNNIARNTIFLYIRMLFSLVVSFFTASIVLNTLGVTDYGIYNVVGGLVTMFSIVSTSLSSASSRYITFELGKANGDVRGVFNASLQIHIILGILVVFLLETVGLWFLYNKMIIPEGRMEAVFYVYQFSTISFFISLLSVSYNANIMAREHMDAYAYVGILDVILRLIILFILKLSNGDKLILYGFLQMLVTIILQCTYFLYCRRHFPESKICFHIDFKLLKSITSFSGWNFIGASAALLKDQGVNILINMFFGPNINAARGIGVRVNSMVSGFGGNLLAAINPRITKSYAEGNLEYCFKLVNNASRFGFLLLFFVSFPLLLKTESLLSIWLGIIPNFAVILTQLALVCTLIDIISVPLITLMLATGNIKRYQIIVGGTLLLNVPLSYIVLKLGFTVEYSMYVAGLIGILCLILRIVMLNRIVGFNYNDFISQSILKIVVVVFISTSTHLLFNRFFGNDFISSLIYITIMGLFNGVIIIGFGLKQKERGYLYSMIISKYRLICKK